MENIEILDKLKNYSSRGELHDKNRPLYDKVKNLGLLDEYFGPTKYVKKTSPGYWNKENVFKESKKYKTICEFRKKHQYAYKLALENNWINEMTWLKSSFLTKEECINRAKKYASVSEFNKNEPRAYQKSLENCWLDEMNWLTPTKGTMSNPIWTFASVFEVASQCVSRIDFHKRYPGAAQAAKKNGWYNKLGLPEYIIKGKVYCDYSYEWCDLKTAYVGLTYRKEERNKEHHGLGRYSKNSHKSPVYKFAIENNKSIPDPIYHADGLTLEEAQKLENDLIIKYKLEGWTVLNKGKTGKGIGSYGNAGIKWCYENTYNEAKKYKTSGEFAKNSGSAYSAARKNGWLTDYIWMKFGQKMTIKEAIERADKYKTRTEFAINDSTAYALLCNNGKDILNKIFGVSKRKEISLDECIEIAKKYKYRNELAKAHSSVYNKLRQNNLLDSLFQTNLNNGKKVIQLTLENVYIKTWKNAQEAANKLGLHTPSNIWMCCNGKKKTYGGFIWKYEN